MEYSIPRNGPRVDKIKIVRRIQPILLEIIGDKLNVWQGMLRLNGAEVGANDTGAGEGASSYEQSPHTV